MFNQTGWIIGALSVFARQLAEQVGPLLGSRLFFKIWLVPNAFRAYLFTAIGLSITSISALLTETFSHVQRANGLVENFSSISAALVAEDANLIRELVVVQASGLVLIGVYALFVHTLSSILRHDDQSIAV